MRRLPISLKRIFSLIVVFAMCAVCHGYTSAITLYVMSHPTEAVHQPDQTKITRIRLQGFYSPTQPYPANQPASVSTWESENPKNYLSEYTVVQGSTFSTQPDDFARTSIDNQHFYPAKITRKRTTGYSSRPTHEITHTSPDGSLLVSESDHSQTQQATQEAPIRVTSPETLSPQDHKKVGSQGEAGFNLFPGSNNMAQNIIIILSLLMISMLILVITLYKSIQVRRTLQRSEKRFKVLLGASPSAIMILQNYKLKYVNNYLEVLTGFTKDELLTMDIWQLIHPENLKELSKKNSFIGKAGLNFRGEFQIITKASKIKWVDFSTRFIEFENLPSILATAIDITDRKKYEQKLVEAEKRYSLILMASKDGIFDYNIPDDHLYLSPQWKEMLGYLDDELNGGFIEWLNQVNHEDRREVHNLLEKLKSGESTSETIEYRMLCRDGSFKWVWATFLVIFDLETPQRILGTLADITERKITEEMLKESEFRYKSLFSKNSAVMIITEPKTGNILDINQAAVNYYGYDRRSLMGMNISEINVLREDLINEENIQAEKEKRSYKYSQHRLADGNIRDVEVYTSKIPVKSGIMEYSIIFDITERKKIELELQKVKEKDEEAFRTKSYFISYVSHEIRTPLNAIAGLTDLIIQNENLAPSILENIKSIKYSSDHLLSVINDILDFSRLEAGRVVIEKTDFDIHTLVMESVQTINFRAKEKRIAINILIGPDVPRILVGDPLRLRQIMLNLLGNAIKFTIEGHIDIAVKPINEYKDKIDLLFSISDTGIGISENKLDEIFESFYQAETNTSRKFGGTGLGLTICKKLVELQGGTIGVKSLEGMGATFWFNLTYEKSQKTNIPDKSKGIASMKNLRGIKILLVEDDKMNQFVVSQIIKKWLAQIDVVDNGIMAIEKLEKKKYNLVLMDLHLPELDGYETTKVIRNPDSNVQDHDVPIIALTADVSTETMDKVKHSGMNDLITKPSSPDQMFEKIMQAVINNKTRIVEKKAGHEDYKIKEPWENDERTKNRIRKALADIFDEDMEGTMGLINRFLKDIPKTVSGINEAFYDNDFDTLGALVHQIKPGYSYMGFREVSEKIDKIQIMAKRKTNPHELERLCIELDNDSQNIVKILMEIRAEYMHSNSVELPPRL